MLSKNTKFVLANIFFFGIVGSYIGGAIFLVSWFILTHLHHSIGYAFFLSPLVGFIPAALTGFLYSITYIKRKGAGSLVAALYGFLVMSLMGFLLVFLDPTYDYDINYNQHIDVIYSGKLILMLSLLGALSAFICRNLVNKWFKYDY